MRLLSALILVGVILSGCSSTGTDADPDVNSYQLGIEDVSGFLEIKKGTGALSKCDVNLRDSLVNAQNTAYFDVFVFFRPLGSPTSEKPSEIEWAIFRQGGVSAGMDSIAILLGREIYPIDISNSNCSSMLRPKNSFVLLNLSKDEVLQLCSTNADYVVMVLTSSICNLSTKPQSY